jgi:hypothetical protein
VERLDVFETMNFLRSHGLYYPSIDAPEDSSIVPSFIEATGDQVYAPADRLGKSVIGAMRKRVPINNLPPCLKRC